jgi:hypothetical protein
MRPNLPHKFASKKTRTLKCMVTLIFSIYLDNLNIICRYDISKLLLRGYILLVHHISAPIFTSKKAQGLWCCPSDRLGVEVALAQTILHSPWPLQLFSPECHCKELKPSQCDDFKMHKMTKNMWINRFLIHTNS